MSISSDCITDASRMVPVPASSNCRVALGMSGGVDSSVAAALLLEAGYEVLGVTCIFDASEKSDAAVADARYVADQLDIEHIVRDCTGDFEETVVSPFVDAYQCGRTPSPCPGCNAACKFPALIAAADENGCAYVATGHYARIVRKGTRYAVACAADPRKDQSYMLGMLTQEQLARIIFPLGGMHGGKLEVRGMAQRMGLCVAQRPDSQDICFIEGSHVDFLEARGVICAQGDIVDANGYVLGRHKGLHRYTLGQRKGLGIGGAGEPYYVIDKDTERNELLVGHADDVRIGGVLVSGLVWQALSPEEIGANCGVGGIEGQLASGAAGAAGAAASEGGGRACDVKLRYRQQAAPCRITPADTDMVCVELDKPTPLTAPGQYAVLYDGDVVLGAGVIDEVCRLAAPDT